MGTRALYGDSFPPGLREYSGPRRRRVRYLIAEGRGGFRDRLPTADGLLEILASFCEPLPFRFRELKLREPAGHFAVSLDRILGTAPGVDRTTERFFGLREGRKGEAGFQLGVDEIHSHPLGLGEQV